MCISHTLTHTIPGGAKRVLIAMDNHKLNANVQLAGCKAIRNLAVSADNRAQISSSVWGFKRILGKRSQKPTECVLYIYRGY